VDKFTVRDTDLLLDEPLDEGVVVDGPGDRKVRVVFGAKGRLHIQVEANGVVLAQLIVPSGAGG
jgi:hypothetical protein